MRCKNCSKDFVITDADRRFYNKIEVPEPKICSECRLQLMLSFRNARTLYARKCDYCQKNIIAMYAASSPYKVYCQECWWSDNWSGTDFGVDYLPGESLFSQLEKLQKQVPRIALFNVRTENSEFNNHIGDSKDCYACSVVYYSEDIYYSYWLLHQCQACVDCSMCYSLRQSYDCFRVDNSYHCLHCQRCDNLVDSAFCFDCRGGQKLLFCTGLRGQSYQIFNKSVTPEEFERQYQNVLHSAAAYAQAKEKFKELIKNFPRRSVNILKSERCIGDEMVNASDCWYCFDLLDGKNNRYVYAATKGAEDCMDCYGVLDSRFSYYVTNTVNTSNIKLARFIWDCANVEYSDLCFSSHDLFGCIGLRNQKFCILNKQYGEEDYLKLKTQIIEQMSGGAGSGSAGKKTGEYGEFFPPQLSPFAYNDTMAHELKPLTKSEALAGGWTWQDNLPGTFGLETMTGEKLPESIEEVTDGILKEVLACSKCQKNYKIIPQELKFYRQNYLPLPRWCPNCRHLERQENLLPYHLWERQCAKCLKKIETAYAPSKPERIFCGECYQKEIY